MTNTNTRQHTRLLNRDFLLLWQGQAVSGVGSSLFQVSMLYWLMEATGSATVMGVVSMMGAIPGVILGPFGGAIADRFSRKKLIVIGDLVLGVAMLSLAIPFYLFEDELELQIGWMIVVSIITGIVGAFFRPAVMAAIPSLVPMSRLNAANALNSASMTTSQVMGQAAGGVLYRMLGIHIVVLINGISYLLSGFTELFMDIPQERPARIKSWRALAAAFWVDIKVGLKYVWEHAGLRNMIVAFALLNLFTAPLSILMPILLDKWLHLPADWFGYLMAAMGVGSLIGMTLAGMMRIDGGVRFAWIVVALYSMALVNLVYGLVEDPFVLLGANLMSGVFMGVMMVNFTTLMQATTPDELRGRVTSVMMAVMMGSVPIAMGMAGVLADLVNQNIPMLFVGGGILSTAVVTGITVNSTFRQFMSTRLLGSRSVAYND